MLVVLVVLYVAVLTDANAIFSEEASNASRSMCPLHKAGSGSLPGQQSNTPADRKT